MSSKKEQTDNLRRKELNQKYGDSVFRHLFGTEDEARELYNLLTGKHYGKDARVEIQTLDNDLFVDRVNDLAFTIDDRLIVLVEHQKTLNENMPFRMLMYTARTLEKLYGSRRIFQSEQVKLQSPEFFMLYDGDAETEPVYTLRLSDAYLEPAVENSAEVVVKVLNIRYNKNKEILKNNSTLAQYSRFTDIVRKVKEEGCDGETALQQIMLRCHEEGILVDYLEKHSKEAIRMAWGEFNLDEYIDGEKELSWEKGVRQGIEQGVRQGAKDERAALKAAATYLRQNARGEEVEKLILDTDFFQSILKEAGIAYGQK